MLLIGLVSILLLLEPLNARAADDCGSQYRPHENPLFRGALTALWAQEFMGVDLAREEFRREQGRFQSKTVPVAIDEKARFSDLEHVSFSPELEICRSEQGSAFCRYFHLNEPDILAQIPKHILEHGSAVAHLVIGGTSYGSGFTAELAFLEWLDFRQDSWPNLMALVREGRVRIYSNSGRTLESSELDRALVENRLLLIHSTGNHHGERRYRILNGNSYQGKSVAVTNLGPLCLLDATSSTDEGFVISGASGSNALATRFEGVEINFGGTSGAQPLVAGAVANLESMLPGLTIREAHEILRRSALPTENKFHPEWKSGEGTASVFLSREVAKRLRAGWPGNRVRIISDRHLYDFSREADAELAQANTLGAAAGRCALDLRLRHLRRAFHFEPQRESVRLEIASLYDSLGFKLNAACYRSLSGLQAEQLLPLAAEFPNLAEDVFRYAEDKFGAEQAERLLRSALASNDPSLVINSIVELGRNYTVDAQVKNVLAGLMTNVDSHLSIIATTFREHLLSGVAEAQRYVEFDPAIKARICASSPAEFRERFGCR